ncbi:immunoglobulin-like and fibronectin type III domain-containing protein 1.1 isoform X2 [Sebastes fasciatus]|uniref:immunoglobulin-like and fibronectin type III domain-containing protein 1.1 isoform X2 n=1 Tax=Sebastes fasciatus TaxID=394691 RepID=UPI003D9F5343
MWKKSKVTDQTAAGQAGIKIKSKVPGVMITQFKEELPEGMTTPDFTRKPIALTIQEGKFAVFKAKIVGTPTPIVTWSRANGEIHFHPDVCQQKYDEVSEEYTIEFPKVTPEDADTYKCFATNEHGKAVCTVVLNVIEVGFSKTKELQKKKGEDVADIRKKLKKRNPDGTREEKPMESEEKVWEILLSAEKKDYERICADYGITDFRRMLKKLTEMKKEREVEIAEFVTHINTLKHIEVNDDDCATFELDMDLKDPTSKLFLYKNGVMVPFTQEESDSMKHNLKQVGKKYIFTIKNLGKEDAGLYSVDVGGVNVFSTDFKVPECDFAVKIQEVKAEERQDALFQCVLTAPMNELRWLGKNTPLTNDEKHEITVSEDKLIHKLLVRDCLPLDAGIYVAVAGIKSCNAWLVVDVDKDPANKGKKATRKTTMAGGGNDEDLLKIAKEQQEKYQKELEEKLEMAKKAQAEREVAEAAARVEAEAAKKTAAEEKAAALAAAKAAAKAKKEAGAKDRAADEAADAAARKNKKKQAGAADGSGGTGGAGGVGGVGDAGGEDGGVDGTGAGAKGGAGGGAGGGEGEDDSFGDSDGGEGGEGGEGGGKGGRRKKRDGPLVPDTVIGDNSDEETTDQQGGKSGKKGKRPKKTNVEVEEAVVEASGASGGNGTGPAAGCDEVAENGEGADGGEPAAAGKRSGRARQGPLIVETVSDPGVHFHAGLSDCKAIVGEAAELECKVSSEDCVGIWYKDGEEITSSDGITITKDGTFHRLKIHKVTEDFAGKYKFEADGRKTESMIVVEDPPRFCAEELEAFKKPVIVKKGHKATFKLPYVGRDPIKIQWYLDGEELSDESNIKLEHTEGSTRLLLSKLQRKDSGEVKIKLKNEFGTIEAFSQLVVTDKPTPPMGPLEIVEATASAIDFKWRPPKDSGGCKIDNYILERQQVGRNTWKKVGPIGPEATYRDTDVDHGRRYCFRIRVETEMGTSELMETEDIQAGTKAYPAAPSAPKVVSAFKNCITLSWTPPSDTGGTNILGYNIEKRKKGSNLWGQVNPPDEMIKGKEYGVKDVVEGMQYEFRVSAINNSGAGESSTPSEFVFARDPKKPPGKVMDFKVTDSTYTTLCLAWTKPKDIEKVEDEAKGYFIEIRPAENTEWDRCNPNAITMNTYTVKGLKSMGMYWVRAIATNDGGEGKPQELDNYILATPPPVRPRFTDAKIKSFMVVRAGNSARFNINFEASPWPDVVWLKDGSPVSKKVTISNAEGTSQLLIPSAERGDTGIYNIIVKNFVGQESYSIEIRVTDEPKPPGPVDTDENVPGTVTVSWTPSPDEKRDDRLHYMVTKRDSSKRTWMTVADHIFNNKFTACNIMPGREYQFRVYAKNDMGSSKPSESPKWLISCKKEKFTVTVPATKPCDLQCPPKFLVPLKLHTAPNGYECYMSCAIKGDPTPHVTWLRNNISLNTNTNYFISNTCGVCSLLILTVGPKDCGEYKIVVENAIGRAECSTKLTVREF